MHSNLSTIRGYQTFQYGSGAFDYLHEKFTGFLLKRRSPGSGLQCALLVAMMEYYPEAAGPAYADPFVNSCILPAKFLHGVAGQTLSQRKDLKSWKYISCVNVRQQDQNRLDPRSTSKSTDDKGEKPPPGRGASGHNLSTSVLMLLAYHLPTWRASTNGDVAHSPNTFGIPRVQG